jgi:hypothetical protein
VRNIRPALISNQPLTSENIIMISATDVARRSPGMSAAAANLTSTRRAFLAQAASTAVLAAAVARAAGATNDPVFAAIDAHKVTRVAVYAAIDSVSAMGKQLIAEGLTRLRDRMDDPRLIDAEAALSAAFEAETDAACVLVTERPTTIAGVLALLNYANKADTDGEGWPDALYADEACKKIRSWHFLLIEGLAEILPGMVQA